jgi:hypothetical protein
MMFRVTGNTQLIVMAVPGLDPGINPAIHERKTWMPGTWPGMTVGIVRE